MFNMGTVDVESVQLSEQHEQIKVTHETSVSDPYFYAPLDLNPINTHNHTGFLYMSSQPQYPSNLSVHISPGSVQTSQPVVITAGAIDGNGNPCPNVLLTISYQVGNALPQTLSSVMTNVSGESYFTFRPTVSGTVIVQYQDKSAQASVNVYTPDTSVAHLGITVSPHSITAGTLAVVSITMSDRLWEPASGIVTLQYTDSSGSHTVMISIVNGVGQYIYTPLLVPMQITFTVSYEGLVAWDTLLQVS